MSEVERVQPQRPDILAWAALATLIFLYGSSFYWNVLILSQYTGWTSGAIRLTTAAVFLLILNVIFRAGLPRTFREWSWSALFGIMAFCFPFLTIAQAQTVVPSNLVGVLFASVPLMMLAMSRLFLGVTISARKWVGCGVGSAGLVYLVGPGALSQIGSGAGLIPVLAILAACASLAGAAIVIRVMPAMPILQSTTAGLLVTAAVCAPILFAAAPIQAPTPVAAFGILGGAILTTALGQLVRVFLVRRKGPVFITPNAYLAAIVSVIMGVYLLGETFTVETASGFAAILIGVLVAQDGTGTMKRI